MAIQNIKTNVAALAMALAPVAVYGQSNIKQQNDNMQTTVILDKNSLPRDVFEKSDPDSTTITFEDAQKTTKENVQDTSGKNQDGKQKVKEVIETAANVIDASQDTTKSLKEDVKVAIEKKSPTVSKVLFNPNIKKEIGIKALYGSEISAPAAGINAKIYTDKVEVGGDIMLSKTDEKRATVYGLNGKYFVDMSKGFYIYPKVALDIVKVSKKDDQVGTMKIVPVIDAGVKYVKDFDCGVKLEPCFEIGASLIFKQAEGSTDYQRKFDCDKIGLDFLLRLATHYKCIVVFVNGGKDAPLGYYVVGGMNFKF